MAPTHSGLWWRYALRHPFLAVFVILTVFAPMIGVVGRGVQSTDRRFQREGVPVEATVTGKSRFLFKRNWTNKVTYHYRAGDRDLEGSGTIPDAPWARLAVGDPLPVKYLPGDPQDSRPAVVSDETLSRMGFLVIGIAAALTALGLLGVALSVLGVSRRVRLLRTSETALAVIDDVIRQHGVIVYRYADADGGEHEGRLLAPRGIGEAREPGDTLLVVVDPKHPARHEVDLFGVRAGG